MLNRRLGYLAVLAGSAAYFLWHRQWLSWVLLIWVLCLPLLSLLVSLPAMCRIKATFACQERAVQGDVVRPVLQLNCKWPMPLVRCRIQVQHPMNGDSYLYELGENLQTDHCGVRQLRIWRLWVYDYLGLFRRRLRGFADSCLVVEPLPVPLAREPELHRVRGGGFKPKNGGFSEYHELRLYHPGDELRLIHWKLSAKTGSLMLRQPMAAQKTKMVLSMVLSGDANALDRKLGQLLWAGQYLLRAGCAFEIRCVTGGGMVRLPVADAEELQKAMHTVLGLPVAADTAVMPRLTDVSWQQHIGGNAHEA